MGLKCRAMEKPVDNLDVEKMKIDETFEFCPFSSTVQISSGPEVNGAPERQKLPGGQAQRVTVCQCQPRGEQPPWQR